MTGDGLIEVLVVGAHLDGQPLNHQLTDRGAELVERTTTTASYRLYALADTTPPKPALRRVGDDGAAIEVEVWALDAAGFGAFVDEIPAPLGIGRVEIVDGRWVSGFICDDYGYEGATDITHHGGWRSYLDAGRP